MITPKNPTNEKARLQALRSYKLLDTLPENAYDAITSLAAHVCDTPISLVALMDADRNYLKSRHGVSMAESPRDLSFCGHAIVQDDPIYIVEDARVHPNFKDNPLVTEHNAIFYAGVPLRTKEGYALGTLCIYDDKPRELSDNQKKILRDLAHQVLLLFNAHKQNIELRRAKQALEERNEHLQVFSRTVAHDLKSPLASLEGLLYLLKSEYNDDIPEDIAQYINMMTKSTTSLREYIDGLMGYYEAANLTNKNKEDVTLATIVNKIKNRYPEDYINIEVENDVMLEDIVPTALNQVLTNLIDNAIKYNDKDSVQIGIKGIMNKSHYLISVSDNGMGIPRDKQHLIFDIFKTAETKDRNGKTGTGIGLASVKKIVEDMEGTISVASEQGKGSTFTFTIKR